MTWTPETNRIPFVLLTDDEKAALKACEHGWEFYNYNGEWSASESPQWFMGTIYRAKPEPPKRIVTWLQWDKRYGIGIYESVEGASSTVKRNGGWVKRIECNEDGSDVVVTDVEVIE